MFQSPFFTLAFWLILLPALWASGSLAAFRLREKDPLFAGILTLGLGLGVYAYFLILVSFVGWLGPGAVLCFLALSLILGWRTGMRVFRWLKDVLLFFSETSDVFSRVCQVSLLGTFVFTALVCFLPEIANDALAIQLYSAKLFVRNASFSPSFYDISSYRPLLMSVFYTTGLLFQNVAISKFFHWFCGALLVCALASKVAEATQNKKIALWGGLMLWLTPTLMNQITTTYIDAGVSLFVFLGYCVVIESFDDLKPSNFFYGGLLIGLAVAIRSLSLGAFFAIMAMLSLRFFQRGIKMRVTIAGGCFALGVCMSSAYWFLRDWAYTGNPVYPYFGALFGTEDFSLFSSMYFNTMGLPRSLGSFLTILWDITFKPQYFDYHHWVGPVYLSVLPFVLYAGIKIKKARPHLQFVFLFATFWYFMGQNVRYLLPALPIYLLAGTMGISVFLRMFNGNKWWRTGLGGIAYLLIFFLLAIGARHFRYQFLPLLGIWNKDLYLSKLEQTAPAANWINSKLPQSAKILILGEAHLYYFDREVILEGDFNVRTHGGLDQNSPAIAKILKEKGMTHILDVSEIPGFGPSDAPSLTSRPRDLFLKDARFVKVVTSLHSANVLGKRFQYILYELV